MNCSFYLRVKAANELVSTKTNSKQQTIEKKTAKQLEIDQRATFAINVESINGLRLQMLFICLSIADIWQTMEVISSSKDTAPLRVYCMQLTGFDVRSGQGGFLKLRHMVVVWI
jgi:hypothetical protein